MKYQVRFVSDSALPAGVDWVFARGDERTYLFVKESTIDSGGGCAALDRARDYWHSLDPEPAFI